MKQFIIRKYVMAKSASEAIKKDRTTPVDDVWVDEEWKKNNPIVNTVVGFVDSKKNNKNNIKRS